MKKYWKEIVLGSILVIILIPLGVAYMLSFKFIITDTTNEWIGFWGGYLGAILGGIITLLVMYFSIKDNKENLKKTLEFENKKILNERKAQFNDELLKQLVEYQTILENYCISLKQKISQTNDDKDEKKDFEKLVLLSKVITIKLYSKKGNSEYLYLDELLKQVEDIADEIGCSFGDNEKRTAVEIINDFKKKVNVLMKGIEKYYVINEQ